MAEALDVKRESDRFHHASMYIQLPDSVIERIKSDGVQEYLEKQDRISKEEETDVSDIHEGPNWYQCVSDAQADEIIQSRQPLGRFVCVEDGGTVVGIDNRTGDAWTEDFPNLRECLLWLADEKEIGD